MAKADESTKATEPKKPNSKAKRTRLREMLARKRGASIAQIQKALAWQPHTIRAEISRLRKTGTEVLHDRSVSPPVYRIVTATAP
ncbi:MAG: DUF3489 domain-containing protein [Pseudomonadota bacterium]